MDLLPGPIEDAAVEGVRPFVDVYFGVERAAELLRTGAQEHDPIVDAAAAAGLFDARPVTAEAQVAVELGRTLAPLEVVFALLAGQPARVAFAVPRPRGGFAAFGPTDADVVMVGDDDGIAYADGVEILERVDCLDPTTRMALVEVASITRASEDVAARVTLLLAAVHAGLARGAHDMAVAYARTRVQFDRPIGANQAVKHLCADTATRCEAAWAALLYASVSLAEGRADARFQVAVAARIAVDAAVANGRTNIQVHGGRGYTLECPAHLFLARAQVLEQVGGGPRRIRRALLEHEPLV